MSVSEYLVCVKCSYFSAVMSSLVLEVFEVGRMRLLPHTLSFVGEGNRLLNSTDVKQQRYTR
jgi:hypothetical protein